MRLIPIAQPVKIGPVTTGLVTVMTTKPWLVTRIVIALNFREARGMLRSPLAAEARKHCKEAAETACSTVLRLTKPRTSNQWSTMS